MWLILSITIMTNTYPFVVCTNSKYSAFWIINQRTGERVSKKNLSEKQANELAQEKYLEMMIATEED